MSWRMQGEKPRNWGSDRETYATTLESHSVATGVTAVPCRACGRMIALGDHCMAHRHRNGFACVTCGWWKLDEITGQLDDSRGAFTRTMALKPGDRLNDGDTAKLLELRIVERVESEKSKLRWTDGGKRLAAEFRERAFKTFAKVGG